MYRSGELSPIDIEHNFLSISQDLNIILNVTHEYREPTAADVGGAAKKTAEAGGENYKLPMTSRFVGQVVIPGQHIVKIQEVRSGR